MMIVDLTPEEDSAFNKLAASVVAFIGHFHPEADLVSKPVCGSGVLVTVGGVTFVLTASHVLSLRRDDGTWEEVPTDRLVLAFNHEDKLARRLEPGQAIRRVFRSPNFDLADVAAIELEPHDAVLWRHSKPLGVEQMAHWSRVNTSGRVVLVGTPGEALTEPEVIVPPETDGGIVRFWFGVNNQPYFTRIATAYNGLAELRHGRGFHVAYQDGVLPNGDIESVDAAGYSGGAVIALDEAEPKVIGLACIVDDEKPMIWCEPIDHVLAVLLGHPNEAVTTEVRQALARLAP